VIPNPISLLVFEAPALLLVMVAALAFTALVPISRATIGAGPLPWVAWTVSAWVLVASLAVAPFLDSWPTDPTGWEGSGVLTLVGSVALAVLVEQLAERWFGVPWRRHPRTRDLYQH
jgi:hypothetical protein